MRNVRYSISTTLHLHCDNLSQCRCNVEPCNPVRCRWYLEDTIYIEQDCRARGVGDYSFAADCEPYSDVRGENVVTLREMDINGNEAAAGSTSPSSNGDRDIQVLNFGAVLQSPLK